MKRSVSRRLNIMAATLAPFGERSVELRGLLKDAADEIDRLRKALQSVDALWTHDASLGFEDEMGCGSPVGKVWAEVRAALTSPDKEIADGGERG